MAQEIIQDDIDDDEMERDQYLVFSVKAQEFGIQAMRVKEISAVFDVTKVPNSPLYTEGIMNLRGQLMTVIDFRKKFGFKPKERDDDTRIIVVEYRSFPVGIIVDSVEEVIKVSDEKVQKLPELSTPLASKESVTGVGMLDGRLVILLDEEKLFSKNESIEVEAIRDVIKETKDHDEDEDKPITESGDRGSEAGMQGAETPKSTKD